MMQKLLRKIDFFSYFFIYVIPAPDVQIENSNDVS